MPSKTPWADNPRIDWLLKHLLLDHGVEPDDFEGDLNEAIQAFHDGVHGFRGATTDHDGYSEARAAEKDWLSASVVSQRDDA